MPSFATDTYNGLNTSDQDPYGPRPLIIDSTRVNPYSSNGKKNKHNALAQAPVLINWIMTVMVENQHFRMGHSPWRRYEYQIGQHANIKEWDEEFYFAGVTHNFVYPPLWTTTLQVVRGRPSLGTGTAPNTAPNNPSGRSSPIPVGPTTNRGTGGGSTVTTPISSGGYTPMS